MVKKISTCSGMFSMFGMFQPCSKDVQSMFTHVLWHTAPGRRSIVVHYLHNCDEIGWLLQEGGTQSSAKCNLGQIQHVCDVCQTHWTCGFEYD